MDTKRNNEQQSYYPPPTYPPLTYPPLTYPRSKFTQGLNALLPRDQQLPYNTPGSYKHNQSRPADNIQFKYNLSGPQQSAGKKILYTGALIINVILTLVFIVYVIMSSSKGGLNGFDNLFIVLFSALALITISISGYKLYYEQNKL